MPIGQSTWYVYDAAGQLTHTISALWRSQREHDMTPLVGWSTAIVTLDRLGAEHGRRLRRRRRYFRSAASHMRTISASYVVYDNDGRARFTLQGNREQRLGRSAKTAMTPTATSLKSAATTSSCRMRGSPPSIRPVRPASPCRRSRTSSAPRWVTATTTPSTLASVQRTRLRVRCQQPSALYGRFVRVGCGERLRRGRECGEHDALCGPPDAHGHTPKRAIDAAVNRNDPNNQVTRYAYDAAASPALHRRCAWLGQRACDTTRGAMSSKPCGGPHARR